MKTTTTALLADLKERTVRHILQVEALEKMSSEELNWKREPNSWSILECIAHLNLYGDFYVPEVRQRMDKSSYSPSENFKSGWLGNYFANAMLPKEKLNTMKTFSSMNPAGSNLDKSTLEKFKQQLKNWQLIFTQAEQVNLQKTKTGITISSWIKLRLGDTLRVVIYHNERHLVQAFNVVKYYKNQ